MAGPAEVTKRSGAHTKRSPVQALTQARNVAQACMAGSVQFMQRSDAQTKRSGAQTKRSPVRALEQAREVAAVVGVVAAVVDSVGADWQVPELGQVGVGEGD